MLVPEGSVPVRVPGGSGGVVPDGSGEFGAGSGAVAVKVVSKFRFGFRDGSVWFWWFRKFRCGGFLHSKCWRVIVCKLQTMNLPRQVET